MRLNDYTTLGRSGLRVSPFALGTMTFGSDWGWGADASQSRRLLDMYLDHGGNFVDTANFYTGGTSEELLGGFLEGRRERVVLATKYSLSLDPENINAGGNHRRSMVRSVEASLRRLRTDYIDLLYLHIWDGTTPVDEVMRAFDDLVRAGKVLYAGISDTPAWQVARMQTLAELRGWSPLIALQLPYSLAERSVERDLLPMAAELGLGVVGWSPLAFGVLTGKYTRQDLQPDASPGVTGSRKLVAANHSLLNERTLAIADEVARIARERAHTPAQVAIAWLLHRTAPAVLPILGVRTPEQLQDNLQALDVRLDEDALRRLDRASCIELGFPHDFMQLPTVQANIHGRHTVRVRA
jgi:aryl-alcohol dehydrogenase-like predicted oxidoreductase